MSERRSVGLSSTKPTMVEAVLGMLEELLRDQLADVAGADDERVLLVRVGAPGERAPRDAADGDEQDRRGPEGEELAEVGARCGMGQPACPP